MRVASSLVTIVCSSLVGVAACANDPQYIQAPTVLTATADMMGVVNQPIGALALPIKPESTADAQKRMALASQLGVAVPYVKVGDLAVEIEWTIKNPDTMPGQAKVELNGGNELFYFDPKLVNLAAPNDREAPPTPGLQGDIPIDVPASGEVSGLFREDQVLEASIDLDMITRGNVNPFHAVLTINKNVDSFQPMTAPMPANMNYTQTPTGPVVPRAAFAHMVCFQIVFKPDRPMTLEYTVRVRDIRGGLVHERGNHAPAGELVTFAPMAYTVGAPKGPAVSPCLPM